MNRIPLSQRIRPGSEAAPWVVDEVKKLEAERDALRAMRFARFKSEDCWIYQGDGGDKLDTLVCPVVISPATLSGILSERDAMRDKLDALYKEADKFGDGIDWIQRAMQAETELDALKSQDPVGVVEHMNELCDEWLLKLPIGTKLYRRPTPPALSVPAVVGHLDLGAGGYIDIETALTDDELAALPKGRHALAIVGTYGADGYVPLVPSVPDVDALAQFIRSIDGRHELGAGALAERIAEWIAAAPEVK